MSSDHPTRLIVFCQNCGNKGYMDEVAFYDSITTEVDEKGFEYPVDEYLYQLFHCPICGNVILLKTFHYGDDFCDESDYCYPISQFNPYGVPDNIREAFEAAVATKGISSDVALLALRRTLDMICKDQGVDGDNLYQKIKSLESEEKIPFTISCVCTVIRELGNAGAHGDPIVINPNDLDRIFDYVSTIINYLYTIPLQTYNDISKYCKDKTKDELLDKIKNNVSKQFL